LNLKRLCLFIYACCVFNTIVVAQKRNPLSEKEQHTFDYAFVNGNKEKILNNYDKALEYFIACYKMDPQDAALNYVMADCFFQQKKMIDAEHFCEAAIKLDSKNFWYQELLVDIYMGQKKNKEAAKVLANIGQEKKDAEYLFKAAYLYSIVGDYKKALALLNDVEKKIGLNEEIAVRREQLYLAQNKLPKAIQEIQNLIRTFPNDVKYQGMLADLYWANGKAEDAATIYLDILKKSPQNGFAAFALSDYYKLKHDLENWYHYLKLGMASPDVESRTKVTVLSSFMEGTEFSDQSLRLFELASLFSSANPSDPLSYLVLGDIYSQQRKFDSARLEYRKALAIEPSSFIAWRQTVFNSAQLTNNDSLLRDCEDAISYFPSEPAFYAYGASAAMQLKNYSKAIELAKNGLAITTPDQEELLFQFAATLGDAYHYSNNYTASDSIYEGLIRNDSSNAFALNNYAYHLCLRKTKLETAERLSRKSLALSPDNASYLDTYGWILFTMGNYTRAKEYIEKSLIAEPKNAEVLEHLGDVLYKLNDKQGALKQWNKAKELGADGPQLLKKITNGTWYE
jgi:tetratricopeptide (TPR) repeat protein